MTIGIIIVVLLFFVCAGVLSAVALGLSIRGRVMLLDAKVTVICDELGVTLPVDQIDREDDDAAQIAR